MEERGVEEISWMKLEQIGQQAYILGRTMLRRVFWTLLQGNYCNTKLVNSNIKGIQR